MADGDAGRSLTPIDLALRIELGQLADLNVALFGHFFREANPGADYVAIRFDRTDPDQWSGAVYGDDSRPILRIDGDFGFTIERGAYSYVIAGDATGHYAYAGGLKIFIAMAIRAMFGGRLGGTTAATPEAVLTGLQEIFQEVGDAALRDDPRSQLKDGANIAILRIDRARPSEVTYANAGMALWRVDAMRAELVERSSDGKGLQFPRRDAMDTSRTDPAIGTVACGADQFLVCLSDGFRDLRVTRPATGATSEVERFRTVLLEQGLTTAAERAARSGSPGSKRATLLADSFIETAREFRRGCLVPFDSDDDRLIVVIDPTGATR